ncbi:MAG: acetyl-CoA carboxylase biotin carboxyl carrier protein [Candidatus Omnitrophica bacterium]|nr:acetyl-CoA carboxylase biotin carboxyl carrier protein [Candidatus Omnitrophota bacterium]MDD5429746.1 acetyl-CoA carboxylase biotin carboxyl carrier protein [Candidatus Omnitrophota bacterium]
MEPDKLKKFIKFMEENNLSELEIEEEGKRIRLKKNTSEIIPVTAAPQSPPKEEKQEKTIEIKSPMVGTFYRAPSPGAKPYVEIGQIIKSGDVVCIVEAMKLMNEIKAEFTGRIVKIPVENGEPVEFGQSLFIIEPV